MRTIRLFKILDALRARSRPVSAETIADDLSVSVRTIYRDVATLQGMGAPIRGESGVGYQLEKGYFLPPLHFDEDELDALVLGLRLAAKRADPVLSEAAERVLGKIAGASEASVSDLDRPLLAVGRQSSGENTDIIGVLRRSVRDRRLLDIRYEDLRGSLSERHVRPLGLTAFESAWLLTAWCLSKNDFRNFRIDRILQVRDLGETFPRRSGQEFKDYIATL